MHSDANSTSENAAARPGSEVKLVVVPDAPGASLSALDHDEWTELCEDIERWLDAEKPFPA